MRKLLLTLILVLIKWQMIYNQTVTQTGHPMAEIFADFHLNLNDTSKTTGFGLNRAYLGYNFIPDDHFSGTIIINAGIPSELAIGSLPRRYAYIREASITYSNEKLNIVFGITGTRIFDFQQKFWGKRYIANTYQSINGYGFVADLGVAVDYKISDLVSVDFTVMNGEGYSNIQLDNGLRTSAGISITPESDLAFRLYVDIERAKGIWQPMMVGFAGFKNERFTIGGEISFKANLDLTEGHHAWGISGTGSVNITRKTELFSRYDYSTSVYIPEEDQKWNYLHDDTFLVVGIQYTFNKYVKLALDYQGTFPYDKDTRKTEEILLNALFKF